MRDVANWHAMASACPGMRTDIPDRVIQAVVASVLAGEGAYQPVDKGV